MSVFRLDESRKANDLSSRNAMDKLKKVKKSPAVKVKQEKEGGPSNEELAAKVEVLLNEQKRELMEELEKSKVEFLKANAAKPKTKRTAKKKENTDGEE